MSLMLQNFILFQIGWFSCVLGGASSDFYWAGVAVVAGVILVHLVRAANVRNEVLLIAVTTILGTAWDSGLMLAGLLTFANGAVIPGVVPVWMVAMWALFATTLNVSMKWMKNRYLLAALFGGLGGPIAYYAGHRLGAVEFGNTSSAFLALGIGWAVIMPLLMALSTRFNGYQDEQAGTYEVKPV